jgi:hypothetical protein
MQGKVELAEALGTTGAVRRVEGGKLEGESLLEKRRGTNTSLKLAESRAGR